MPLIKTKNDQINRKRGRILQENIKDDVEVSVIHGITDDNDDKNAMMIVQRAIRAIMEAND